MTPSSRFRRRLPAVRGGGGHDGERGSIVLAMLVTLVATCVAALILPLLISQTKATDFDTRRTQQLAAAQSGVEAALARIRAAGTAAAPLVGAIGALPCGPVVGTVVGSATLRYQVSLTYYRSDPVSLTAAQRLDPANLVTCVAGVGTKSVPAFVGITAIGTDARGTAWTGVPARTVSATYVVRSTTPNVSGGLFRVARGSGKNDLCLDIGRGPYRAGGAITMQKCSADAPGQRWAYRSDLSLAATVTVTSAVPLGLCLDGGSRPQVKGYTVRLQACQSAAPAQQQWSNNDTANFAGTDDGRTLSNECLAVSNPDVVGSTVVADQLCGKSGGYDNRRNWLPDAAVGAGMAGAATQQLVNYAQFGRCLDITDQQRNADHLISWPCKQSPDPASVLWNQRWTLPTLTAGAGTGLVKLYPDGTAKPAWCLLSNHLNRGTQVHITACPTGTPTADYVWKVRGAVASYAASYQLEDAWGDCLQPEPLTGAAATDGTTVSTIVLKPCSADLLQKWNAPADISTPSVKDQQER